MNAVVSALMVVSLLLVTVTVGCAELARERVLPAGETNLDAGAVGGDVPVAVAEPAPEIIKVSRLEPDVVLPAVLSAEDRQLELRKADFFKFAGAKLTEMNRNHILSRERMRIQKLADGSYRAAFHQIDDGSMSFEVKRSPTKTAPYVAVLSYQERIYAAPCGTPDECKQGDFVPVEMIPNRHIFVYRNGAWH